MDSLLSNYLKAVRVTNEAEVFDSSGVRLDQAIAAEMEAAEALRLHVKLAAGVPPSRTIKHPIAAFMDGSLVVVAPSNDDERVEHLHVVHPRDIARNG